MSPPDLHRLLLGPIHRSGIEYMVTGGVAAIAYGEPRLTNGVDIVIRGTSRDAAPLIGQFSAAEYYVPPMGSPRHPGYSVGRRMTSGL